MTANVATDYFGGMPKATWTTNDLPPQHGRRIVITGANSGIGLVAARALAHAGAHVILAVRDLDRGRAAAAHIEGSTEVSQLNLADLHSVSAFAERLEEPIDVLVNNAGIMFVPYGTTKDGFEMHFGTNHLGHFALTNHLLPKIRDRVVTTSSQAHRRVILDLDDPNWERREYRASDAYGASKLANLLFTLELQKRLAASRSEVTAVASHPGYAATSLQSHSEKPLLAPLIHGA